MDNTTATVGYWLVLGLVWLGVIPWNIYIWCVPVEKQRQISREMIASNKYWFPERKQIDLWMVESSYFLWRSRIASILLTAAAIALTVFFSAKVGWSELPLPAGKAGGGSSPFQNSHS
jgi:hypothetical protein